MTEFSDVLDLKIEFKLKYTKQVNKMISSNWYEKQLRSRITEFIFYITLLVASTERIMKTFQLVVRGFQALGLGPQELTQRNPINRKIVKILCILLVSLCSSCAYSFLEAQTFEDYTLSVYVSSTLLLVIVGYTIFMWKNRPIFELFDKAEKLIMESE